MCHCADINDLGKCTIASLSWGWGPRRAGEVAARQQENPLCTVGISRNVLPGCVEPTVHCRLTLPPCWPLRPSRQEIQTGPSLYATDMDW